MLGVDTSPQIIPKIHYGRLPAIAAAEVRIEPTVFEKAISGESLQQVAINYRRSIMKIGSETENLCAQKRRFDDERAFD